VEETMRERMPYRIFLTYSMSLFTGRDKNYGKLFA
jgi:hypothetical protein